MKPSNYSRYVKTETIGRELFIDFDLYTEGDADFKKELAVCLIGNMAELKQDLYRAITENSQEIFLKATHKAKVALSMLDDPELTALTRSLETELGNPAKTENSIGVLAGLFENLTDAISDSLRVVAAS